MFSGVKTLIVVSKDEILINQLRKMVESNDDTENEVIGTKDGTVKIVAWTEKVWLDQKKAGNIASKVLFIDEIKDVDFLIPVLDVKFEKYGVKYGWAGNQAAIIVNPEEIKEEGQYNEFFNELNALPIPEEIKQRSVSAREKKKQLGMVGLGLLLLGPIGAIGAGITASVFADKKAVKNQMLFYGLVNLYNYHLEEFMQA